VAQSTVALSFSPGFQQLLTKCLDQQIRKVSEIVSQSQLSTCSFEEARNPFGCFEAGTVTNLADERDYCSRHFRAVSE
jgi:hypothetical protein